MKEGRIRGYTLLEVLLVIVIVMIFVKGIAPGFLTSAAWTKDQADGANRRRIEGAVGLFKADTGLIPGNILDLKVKPSGVPTWRGPYLDEIPANPQSGYSSYRLDIKGNVVPQ